MEKKYIADFAASLAKEAGAILLRSSRKIHSQKGQPGNFATVADLKSEKFLIRSIVREFKEHAILSEETLSRIARPESVPSLWIIDPLDGTSNFFCGIPIFAVSIAYAEFGKIIAGAIYDPNRDELFSAVKGAGARLNAKKIGILNGSLSGTLVNVGSPYKREDFKKCEPFLESVYAKGARTRNLGSAALQIAYVACGRFSCYLDWGCRPWDVAAGSLILAEAGGTTDFFGGEGLFDSKGFAFSSKSRAKQFFHLAGN